MFLACCACTDRCGAKFIPVALYRFYTELTIYCYIHHTVIYIVIGHSHRSSTLCFSLAARLISRTRPAQSPIAAPALLLWSQYLSWVPYHCWFCQAAGKRAACIWWMIATKRCSKAQRRSAVPTIRKMPPLLVLMISISRAMIGSYQRPVPIPTTTKANDQTSKLWIH